jgi:hypothetical protein
MFAIRFPADLALAGCGNAEPGIELRPSQLCCRPTGKCMGQVPLSVLVVVTLGFVLGGLLTTVTDPSPRWIPILIMGGVAAYLEYHVRSRDQR